MRLHVQAHRQIEQFREEAQFSPRVSTCRSPRKKSGEFRPNKPRQGGFAAIGQPDASAASWRPWSMRSNSRVENRSAPRAPRPVG